MTIYGSKRVFICFGGGPGFFGKTQKQEPPPNLIRWFSRTYMSIQVFFCTVRPIPSEFGSRDLSAVGLSLGLGSWAYRVLRGPWAKGPGPGPGSSWLNYPGSSWLFLAPLGSSWVLLGPSGSSWLLLAPPGSSWLLLAALAPPGPPGVPEPESQEEPGGPRRIQEHPG